MKTDDYKLNFEDTATAFSDKSNFDLQKKHRLFRLINSPVLTGVGTRLTEIAFRLRLPVRKLIKKTIFSQFCGGETIEECQPTINQLGKAHIGTILDYSVEGKSEESVFEATKNEIYRTVTRAREDDCVPFAVFKVTGLADFALLEKVGAGRELLKQETIDWENARRRVEEICGYAHSIGQPVFIDAEESWIQPAVDNLAVEMMEKYNRTRPIVYNTIQLYLKDRLEFLKKSFERARGNDYFLAVKLVRGAYMEKERRRAEELGYASPVQPDKATTDRDYNAALEFCVRNVERVAFVAGTHNERSVQVLAQLMNEYKVAPDHPHVYYSQLYGMGDNLSYVLAKNDFNVSKYVPYGPVRDTIPYLIRRAQENTSVQGQMSRELDLISRELKRRNG